MNYGPLSIKIHNTLTTLKSVLSMKLLCFLCISDGRFWTQSQKPWIHAWKEGFSLRRGKVKLGEFSGSPAQNQDSLVKDGQ